MSLRTELEKIEKDRLQNGRVRIRPIETEADVIYAVCECRLSDEQKELVNPAWFSLGRAYLRRGDNYPCIICNENNDPIGFINFCKWLGSGEAYSWSYFIYEKSQGKGYGRSAAELAISILKSILPSLPIKLSTEVVNIKAQSLYVSLGFRLLPEKDGDDIVFGL